MNTLLKVMYNFARRIKKPIELQISPEKPTTQLQQIDQQLQSQFIPFNVPSTQSQKLSIYQQTVKSKLVKELKSQIDSPLGSIDSLASEKLVNRPNKGVVWGLGGQLMAANQKVHLRGLKNNLEEVLQFLELHQVKNVYVHDFFDEDPNLNRKRYCIVGSCFSGKHCWRTGIQLKNAFILNSSKRFHRRNQIYDPIWPFLNGSKNQEWMLVEYKDFEINLMTEPQRQAADLQWKWNNPVSEERLNHYNMLKLRKGRKNQFEDI